MDCVSRDYGYKEDRCSCSKFIYLVTVLILAGKKAIKQTSTGCNLDDTTLAWFE